MEAVRSGYRILDRIVCSSFSMSVTLVRLQFTEGENQFFCTLTRRLHPFNSRFEARLFNWKFPVGLGDVRNVNYGYHGDEYA